MAVLATGLVLFTLLVNGTTLRFVIRLLRLDRLSPVDEALRDRVLELSYAEIGDTIRTMASDHEISPSALTSALAPYEDGIAAAKSRSANEVGLTDHQRWRSAWWRSAIRNGCWRSKSWPSEPRRPSRVQALLRNAEAVGEGARSGGRLGYQRSAEAALAFPFSFAAAYFFYRRFGIVRFLADRLGDRFEMLLVTRLLIQELMGHTRCDRARSSASGSSSPSTPSSKSPQATTAALDALRRQYPQYAAALEARFLRQSAMRREMGRYDALFQEGLIAAEVYEDLKGSVGARKKRPGLVSISASIRAS